MQAPIRALTLGMDSPARDRLAASLAQYSFGEAPMDVERLMEPESPAPAVIVCAKAPAGVSLPEMAQMLRAVYPEAAIYYVAESSQRQDRKGLIKNGFTDVFFLPVDMATLQQSLREKAALLGSQQKVFKRVKLIDVVPDTVLDFNTYLYLPANGKRVRYSSAGDQLDADRVQKLKSHQVSNLEVPLEEMKKFYEYTAKSLRDSGGNPALSETERAEKLESSVREMVVSLFSDQSTSTDEGKKAVQDMQNIVRTYVTAGASTDRGVYGRILAVSAQSKDTYSHAARASTFAALFAIAVGCPPPEVEEIALAGFLHDLGLVAVPADVLALPQAEWIQADRDVYQTHPEKTLEIVRDRKLVISEGTHKIILQHHERFNGTGFPKRLLGEKIARGARILAIADEFDERLTPKPGHPEPRPADVIRDLLAENGTGPTTAVFDPELLKKIAALFESRESGEKAA
jgi:HD-GYP domain-containing protein (c-di-GMP phosphodiesterase class II)